MLVCVVAHGMMDAGVMLKMFVNAVGESNKDVWCTTVEKGLVYLQTVTSAVRIKNLFSYPNVPPPVALLRRVVRIAVRKPTQRLDFA